MPSRGPCRSANNGSARARARQARQSSERGPMKFSHFSQLWANPGMAPHARYEQLWRELALCDDLGFDHSFCVEHHFRPDESWMSSPSLYAVGAGARTRRMRIGPMGYIVPLYHPLRLAEEIAIVDQMLGGRSGPRSTARSFTPTTRKFRCRRRSARIRRCG